MPPNIVMLTSVLLSASRLTISGNFEFLVDPDGNGEPSIYPGQPIDIAWDYWAAFNDSMASSQVIINVYSESPTAINFAKSLIYTSGPMTYAPGGVSDSSEIWQPTSTSDPLTPVFAKLYHVGPDKKLYLQVLAASGDQPLSRVPVSETFAYFDVWLERISSWSTWNNYGTNNDARGIAFNWNENYTISAILTNETQWGLVLSGTATLQEADYGSPAVWRDISTIAINNFKAGQVQNLDFPNIKKNWSWIIPVIWTLSGDTGKVFLYRMLYNLVDQYGNNYNNVISDNATIAVRVSDRKFAYGLTAQSLTILAASLFALSWLITPAPGSTALGAANGFGAAAKDPPVPSDLYKEVIGTQLRRRRRVPEDSRLGPLVEMLTLADEFAQLQMNLYKVEARVLGAIVARDRASERLQKREYSKTVQAAKVIAEEIWTRSRDSIKALQEWPELNAQTIGEQIARWREGPNKIDQLIASKNAKDFVTKVIASDVLTQDAMKSLSVNVDNVAGYVVSAAAVVARDQYRVMRLGKR